MEPDVREQAVAGARGVRRKWEAGQQPARVASVLRSLDLNQSIAAAAAAATLNHSAAAFTPTASLKDPLSFAEAVPLDAAAVLQSTTQLPPPLMPEMGDAEGSAGQLPMEYLAQTVEESTAVQEPSAADSSADDLLALLRQHSQRVEEDQAVAEDLGIENHEDHHHTQEDQPPATEQDMDTQQQAASMLASTAVTFEVELPPSPAKAEVNAASDAVVVLELKEFAAVPVLDFGKVRPLSLFNFRGISSLSP